MIRRGKKKHWSGYFCPELWLHLLQYEQEEYKYVVLHLFFSRMNQYSRNVEMVFFLIYENICFEHISVKLTCNISLQFSPQDVSIESTKQFPEENKRKHVIFVFPEKMTTSSRAQKSSPSRQTYFLEKYICSKLDNCIERKKKFIRFGSNKPFIYLPDENSNICRVSDNKNIDQNIWVARIIVFTLNIWAT